MRNQDNITVIEGPDDVLSRDYPALFSHAGVHYSNTRQFVAVKKAQLFRDMNAVQRIRAASDLDEVASLSKTVQGFDDANWRRHLPEYLWTAEMAKYDQNQVMAEILLATGESTIVVANSPNGVSGVTQRADDPAIWNPALWTGENLAGKALMKVRTALQKRANPQPTTRVDDYPEPVPTSRKIDICASWHAGYCVIVPRETYLPELLALPREQLLGELYAYVKEGRIDLTGGDHDSNVFLCWVEEDLGIDLREPEQAE